MLDREIGGPRAWRGAEIGPQDWTVPLPPAARAELDAVVARLRRDPLPALLLRPDDFALAACAEVMRPVTWDEWITLPVRQQDNAVRIARGAIRVPTVIVAVNFAKVPKKRPKLSARNIRERDGNRCQYTGRLLHPDEGSLDHVVPRSRSGMDTWHNLVWSAKDVTQRKADRLPHEAGLKLLGVPRAPKELPVTALLRNTHGLAEWKLFLIE